MKDTRQSKACWPKKWILLPVFACFNAVAMAETPPKDIASLDRQVDEAFRQVMKTPANPDVGMNYARLLIANGNYEGGVAALERLLLTADPQPSVRMELAVLYYRLGSYAMVETLLRQALADSRLTADHRALANTLLQDVNLRNQPSQLSGMVMFGMRRQTNPSARSEAAEVYTAGLLSPQAPTTKPQSDTDLQFTGRLDHRYDLGWQNEASWVSSVVAQVTDYRSSSGRELKANQETPYDLAWLELTTGVRFKPAASTLPALRLRPYLIVAELAAQGHRYLNHRGAGLEAEYQVNEKTLVSTQYEYRHAEYANRIDVPQANSLSGDDHSARVQINHELGNGHLLSAEFGVRSHQTGKGFYDYEGQEARLTYSMNYPSPLSPWLSGYWNHAFWVGASQRHYGAADPDIHPNRTRIDRDWRVGMNLSIPLSKNCAALLQVEHLQTDANLPNYQSKNTSLMGAVSYRF